MSQISAYPIKYGEVAPIETCPLFAGSPCAYNINTIRSINISSKLLPHNAVIATLISKMSSEVFLLVTHLKFFDE